MGLGRLVNLDKAQLRRPARAGRRAGARPGPRDRRAGGGLAAVEALYDGPGLPPAVSAAASRVAVPVYAGARADRQGDLHDLVAHAEEADRPGPGQPRRPPGGAAGDGGDGGGGPPPRAGEGGEDAVLQPAPQDEDPPE